MPHEKHPQTPAAAASSSAVSFAASSASPSIAAPPCGPDGKPAPNSSRRHFLKSSAAAAAAAASMAPLARHASAAPAPTSSLNPSGRDIADGNVTLRERSPAWRSGVPATQPVRLTLNGQAYDLRVEPRVTLLDALRDHAGLTGTKKGCDRGQCGACTVLANGRRINSCLSLAVMHDGDRITTVEGLASNPIPSPLQQAFIEQDAFQCGFCTPGQLCSATALLSELRAGEASAVTADVRNVWQPEDLSTAQAMPGMSAAAGARTAGTLDDAEIRERMSGNICRCGAYPNIVSAIKSVLIHKV